MSEMIVPDVIKEPFQSPPIGTLLVKVTEGREAMLYGGQKYGIEFDVECLEPDEAAGITDTVQFAIGTNEDPGTLEEGVKPETFTARAGRVDRFIQSAGLDMRGQKLAVVLSDMKDRQLLGRTIAKKEPMVFEYGKKKGQSNPYGGKYRVEWTSFLRADEGQPVVQTTVAKLMAAENNGTGGAVPRLTQSSTGLQSPPPPAAPSARAPMPPRGR